MLKGPRSMSMFRAMSWNKSQSETIIMPWSGLRHYSLLIVNMKTKYTKPCGLVLIKSQNSLEEQK